jgi:hypothetical protein
MIQVPAIIAIEGFFWFLADNRESPNKISHCLNLIRSCLPLILSEAHSQFQSNGHVYKDFFAWVNSLYPGQSEDRELTCIRCFRGTTRLKSPSCAR